MLVSDGKTLWRANAAMREWSTAAVTGDPLAATGGGREAQMELARARGSLHLIDNLAKGLRHAEILGEENFDDGGRRILCTVVRGDYRSDVLVPPAFEQWTKIFWIDAKQQVLWQEEDVLRGKLIPNQPYLEVENRTLTRYRTMTLDEAIPPITFTYEAPKDYTYCDRLEPGITHRLNMVGHAAPELSLKTLDGQAFSLDQLRGKLVLLDFWATWCQPCRAALPWLAKLHNAAKAQGLMIVGIDDDSTPKAALDFIQGQEIGWPNLFDGREHKARQLFNVQVIPTFVLIDREGVIADYASGFGGGPQKSLLDALVSHGVRLPD